MCKTGKKLIINKINFNEFILFYWKILKKKFWWFFSSLNKKKKKSTQKATGWATAHLSHDTMDCIVTQGSLAQLQGPRYGQARPAT